MHRPSECSLLRVFINENDPSGGRLLYAVTVEKAGGFIYRMLHPPEAIDPFAAP